MSDSPRMLTVTLNTAVDTVLEVPRFAVGGHQAGRRLSRYPAGKGINVSRALARLGCPSIVTGFVGREDALFFRRFIHHDTHSLASSRLVAVTGSTRQNITILDPVHRTDTHLREAGFTVAEADLRRLRVRLLRLPRPARSWPSAAPSRRAWPLRTLRTSCKRWPAAAQRSYLMRAASFFGRCCCRPPPAAARS